MGRRHHASGDENEFRATGPCQYRPTYHLRERLRNPPGNPQKKVVSPNDSFFLVQVKTIARHFRNTRIDPCLPMPYFRQLYRLPPQDIAITSIDLSWIVITPSSAKFFRIMLRIMLRTIALPSIAIIVWITSRSLASGFPMMGMRYLQEPCRWIRVGPFSGSHLL